MIEILRLDRPFVRFEPLLYLSTREGQLLNSIPSDVPTFVVSRSAAGILVAEGGSTIKTFSAAAISSPRTSFTPGENRRHLRSDISSHTGYRRKRHPISTYFTHLVLRGGSAG